MAPKYTPRLALLRRDGSGTIGTGTNSWRAQATPEDFILESWSQGFMVGALLIMACITVANMRRGVLLHRLILTEQLLAMSHGTFCFMAFNGYGWYLSSTAALLYCSWIIHNIVAWMKVRPFFCDSKSMFKPKVGLWVRRIYLGTLACTIPPIILQIFDNFRFFNNINNFYTKVRPYEPLFRDPWWVFTCLALFHVIRRCYGTGAFELVKRSPRFGILLCAIALAMIFTVLDIINSIKNFIGSTDGINPWWKLSLVFKCLTDTIMLDDFKTELKRLGIKRIKKEEARRQSVALVLDDDGESAMKSHSHDELEVSETWPQRNLSSSPRTRAGAAGSLSSPYPPTANAYTDNDNLPLTFNGQPLTATTDDDEKSLSPVSPRTNGLGSERSELSQRNELANRNENKEPIGRAPKKISHLPSLKTFQTRFKSRQNQSLRNDQGDEFTRSAPGRLSALRQSLGV